MLAQEIIHHLKKPNIGSNVIIKLDMAKAYDRVSWSYICLVLRKMGFNEGFIDMCWRIMANNWYSIIINGKRHGFFQSTRGLKQGDPLSPALFILGAEVLSRSLNRLHHHPDYQGFTMEKRGPQVNHLSFADDIILFTSGRCKTLELLMDTLKKYENISGQLINGDKSHFLIHPNAFNSTRDRIKRLTGFKQKQGPITYLGCPLFVGRPRNAYFSNLINKVISRITGWQTKQLSFGGKAVLSKHVLQALPIHLLTAVTPPNTIIKQIQMLIADFFWGWQNNRRKYHWSSWKNLSYPYEEGGIGMRNLHDICKSFQFKQWWTFRTKHTLWGDFLKAKYCQRSNPVSKKWDTGESIAWKHMLATRQQGEQYIQWQLNSGNCSFWWDNWLGTGSLAQHTNRNIRFNNSKVADFWENGNWNWRKLEEQAPTTHLTNIMATAIPSQQQKPDQAVWRLDSHGKFSCHSAWEEIRSKKPKNRFFNLLWHNSIPFKASFLLWRAIKRKLPTNEKLTNIGIEPSHCFCCIDRAGMDSIEHIFNSGQFASRVWSFFAASAGLEIEQPSIQARLRQWWAVRPRNSGHQLMLQATPIFVCWNLWKNRCACKYGGKATNISRVKYAIYKDTFKMLKNSFPHIQWPANWTALIQKIENCKHDIKVHKVGWNKPPEDWVKINTDGSALNNPGKIGAGGIIRDKDGKLLMAFAVPLGEGSNNKAEVEAALFGLQWATELGHTNIIMELDSQIVVQWIAKKTVHHWSVTNQLERIQQLIQQTQQFKCDHIFREANWVADSLSKHSHGTSSLQLYFNSNQMPKEAQAYYQMDLLNMPSFRRKKTKKIFDPP